MDVSSAMASTSASQNQGRKTEGKSSLGSEAFLQLLVTQMKNQDPTAPMESTEYMAQLAAFSQVEQQTSTNEKLDSLLSSAAISQADRFIGRTITSADGTVSGEVESVRVFTDGLVARLTDGRDVVVQAGITVS